MLIDFAQAHNVPAHNVVSNLVFATYPSDVDTLIVGGRTVLKNGVPQGIDEGEVIARAQQRAGTIAYELGFRSSLKPISS